MLVLDYRLLDRTQEVGGSSPPSSIETSLVFNGRRAVRATPSMR